MRPEPDGNWDDALEFFDETVAPSAPRPLTVGEAITSAATFIADSALFMAWFCVGLVIMGGPLFGIFAPMMKQRLSPTDDWYRIVDALTLDKVLATAGDIVGSLLDLAGPVVGFITAFAH